MRGGIVIACAVGSEGCDEVFAGSIIVNPGCAADDGGNCLDAMGCAVCAIVGRALAGGSVDTATLGKACGGRETTGGLGEAVVTAI